MKVEKDGKHLKKHLNVDEFIPVSLILHAPSHYSLCAIFRDLLDQAKMRQGGISSTRVLRYLIGAQLQLILASKQIKVEPHKASFADRSTSPTGDFFINQCVIHITLSPSLALVEDCKENMTTGLKPIIVTTYEHAELIKAIMKANAIDSYVEVWVAEQFLASGHYKLSEFDETARDTTLEQLVTTYNSLIDRYETDPSLRISIGR